jgi:hypothetical protein
VRIPLFHFLDERLHPIRDAVEPGRRPFEHLLGLPVLSLPVLVPVVLLPGFILVALGLPFPVFEEQLALNQFVAFGGVRLLLLHSDVLLDPGDLEVLPCVKDLGSPPAAAD